jgi:hypothetical protein
MIPGRNSPVPASLAAGARLHSVTAVPRRRAPPALGVVRPATTDQPVDRFAADGRIGILGKSFGISPMAPYPDGI